jgi:hypothetical protein
LVLWQLAHLAPGCWLFCTVEGIISQIYCSLLQLVAVHRRHMAKRKLVSIGKKAWFHC